MDRYPALAPLVAPFEREPLRRLREAIGDAPAYLVGGCVRDALLGRIGGDLDIAIDGELDPILDRLGVGHRRHARFDTATADIDGIAVDLARTRSETYAHPGALPEVEPAPIERDLARRDFTANAIALELGGGAELIDPHGGVGDIEERTLRILHPRSFIEDPTRALRAARYAARLGFELEPGTAQAVRETDLSTISADRVDAETLKQAEEDQPWEGFELLDRWGLIAIGADARDLARAVAERAARPPWRHRVDPAIAIHAAAIGHIPGGRRELPALARTLAAVNVSRPSEALAAARGHDELELLLAAATGADWAERWVAEWSLVSLEIDGDALQGAGVPEGPAIGRGLARALTLKLDGEISGREEELAAALEAAGS